MREAAEVLNRILLIRSLPTLHRLFGPARETSVQAFYWDHLTLGERQYYVRQQLKRLLADLELLPHFHRSEFDLLN